MTTKPPRAGDRIRLLAMNDDPDPILIGTTGTVQSVSRYGGGAEAWCQIEVVWDTGRQLMLVSPPDEFEIVRR